MRWALFAAAAITLATSSVALAQTTLPLNTGYNYQTFSLYAQPASGASNVPDNYWIKIASYEPPTPSVPVAPGWILPVSPAPPWAAPLTTYGPSRWVGPRQVSASSPGASPSNPAYSIFRKCFCLMPGYKDPSLRLQARADDNIQVYLNTMTNTLLGPVNGHWNGAPLNPVGTNDPAKFRTGRNCIYVYVEDFWGQMGFDLSGTVSAFGLMPTAGAGTNVSFAPCQCESGPVGGGKAAVADDRAMVAAIVKMAETRRRAAQAHPTEPAKPKS